MASRWLTVGFSSGALATLGALVVAAPVQAATLQYWWFDAQTNQLVFTTDSQVQPRAQLLVNPTRIVVDLPNTQLGSTNASQAVGGAVREVRAGQFDRQTTRLVIELAPGYSLNPQDVRVQGVRPNQWAVQLPTLNQGAAPASGALPPATATANRVQGNTGTGAGSILSGVVTTGDGFLIRLSGTSPTPSVQITSDDADNRFAIIDLPNTAVAGNLRPDDLPNYRYSIIAWDVAQQPTNPPSTRITLRLSPTSPDWRALRNNSGVIVLPPSGVPISSIADEPAPLAAAPGRPPQAQTPPPPQAQTPPSPTPPPTRSAEPVALPSAPSGRVVVAIDPGHGGRDPGAVGIGGLQEKQVIFPISLRVAELLESQGVVVVMTRREDVAVDLQARADIANRAQANLFVSIHANAISMSRPDVNGIESYYSSETGRRLAATLQASMLAATGMRDRGVKQARFAVLRQSTMPATLLEIGFVTGAQDAPRLADPAWRESMAQAIARGILQYIQQGL
ncbi:N-acetylmuramoyl-L-alanine amidase [Phormidium tenue]|uniref:N-acetylmuramoyl-L-alanine amidase n=1 Tax=Phormidium tenue NIES-30 TaxID=549789 RepID=A0A1U7J0A8_9CYAN|nr:N-acetylmuramoyl-L-alanine amidase [Phormidium tenue]MBD2234366.1 N-acetylmuramoyl-L-alanine amidase [Phormidium tenue FACHB-1052]OKH45005.1 N-acetylmuramoyl-L-alanine amidase [Phormidium tenue NIES-30]